MEMKCPRCASLEIAENGSLSNGKKKFMCKECRRQFVENPQNRTATAGTWKLVGSLLLERISKSGIARATGLSQRWICEQAEKKSSEAGKKAFKTAASKRTDREVGEMWTYSGSKKNDPGTGLAIGRKTRPVGGAHVGKRDQNGAIGLWNSLSEDCWRNGMFSADGLAAQANAVPKDRHKIVAEGSGLTSPVERLNLTFRQRVSELAGKTLPFARLKKNLIASVWRFIHSYNEYVIFH